MRNSGDRPKGDISNSDYLVMVVTHAGDTIILSPDEPDRFCERIKAFISPSRGPGVSERP